MDEKSYEQGSRMAWSLVLGECCRHLGYDHPEVQRSAWIKEREEAINMLRSICRVHGDNDWDNDLHLADIIDKHLWRHIEQKA